MKTLGQFAQTIIKVKSIKGTSFVGVRNYINKQGEVSNQTFLVGFDYENMLKRDLEKINSFDINSIDLDSFKAKSNQPNANKVTIDELIKAKAKIIKAIEDRLLSEVEKQKELLNGNSTIKRSKAQQEAYLSVAKGLKAKDNDLFIYGLCVKKTILQQGEYKPTKSYASTLAKKLIERNANLSSSKYKQFKVGNTDELKIQGVTI